jgi:two-component system, cell cycle sensor histidine kinase and response regulator CckA
MKHTEHSNDYISPTEEYYLYRKSLKSLERQLKTVFIRMRREVDEILKRYPESAEADSHLKALVTEMERYEELLADIRLATGDTPVMYELIHITNLLEECFRDYRTIHPVGLTITGVDRFTDLIITADRSLCRRAIWCIIDNAAEATNNNGVLTIGVSLQNGKDLQSHLYNIGEGLYVAVTFSDNGIGIKREIHDRVFEPFFTTKYIENHRGMGLCVTRGIMMSHGGDIVLESDEGKGTSVILYFPVREIEIA